MYQTTLNSHSYWAYFALIFVFAAVVLSLYGWIAGKDFSKIQQKVSFYGVISVSIQAIVGLVLYVISPITQSAFMDFGAAMKNPQLRLYAVEHPFSMLLGVIIISFGYFRLKNVSNEPAKHKRIVISFTIGLIFLLARIPWSAWL